MGALFLLLQCSTILARCQREQQCWAPRRCWLAFYKLLTAEMLPVETCHTTPLGQSKSSSLRFSEKHVPAPAEVSKCRSQGRGSMRNTTNKTIKRALFNMWHKSHLPVSEESILRSSWLELILNWYSFQQAGELSPSLSLQLELLWCNQLSLCIMCRLHFRDWGAYAKFGATLIPWTKRFRRNKETNVPILSGICSKRSCDPSLSLALWKLCCCSVFWGCQYN